MGYTHVLGHYFGLYQYMSGGRNEEREREGGGGERKTRKAQSSPTLYIVAQCNIHVHVGATCTCCRSCAGRVSGTQLTKWSHCQFRWTESNEVE